MPGFTLVTNFCHFWGSRRRFVYRFVFALTLLRRWPGRKGRTAFSRGSVFKNFIHRLESRLSLSYLIYLMVWEDSWISEICVPKTFTIWITFMCFFPFKCCKRRQQVLDNSFTFTGMLWLVALPEGRHCSVMNSSIWINRSGTSQWHQLRFDNHRRQYDESVSHREVFWMSRLVWEG